MAKTRRRRPRTTKESLVVTSNIELPDQIAGWELELLLPVVGDLLDDLLRDLEDDEQAEPTSEAK